MRTRDQGETRVAGRSAERRISEWQIRFVCVVVGGSLSTLLLRPLVPAIIQRTGMRIEESVCVACSIVALVWIVPGILGVICPGYIRLVPRPLAYEFWGAWILGGLALGLYTRLRNVPLVGATRPGASLGELLGFVLGLTALGIGGIWMLKMYRAVRRGPRLQHSSIASLTERSSDEMG